MATTKCSMEEKYSNLFRYLKNFTEKEGLLFTSLRFNSFSLALLFSGEKYTIIRKAKYRTVLEKKTKKKWLLENIDTLEELYRIVVNHSPLGGKDNNKVISGKAASPPGGIVPDFMTFVLFVFYFSQMSNI